MMVGILLFGVNRFCPLLPQPKMLPKLTARKWGIKGDFQANPGCLRRFDADTSGVSGFDSGETSTLGLALRVPPYQGGLTSSQSREAQALLDKAMQDRRDTLLAVTQLTRSLLRNLRTNVQSVKARAQSIRSSETALQATQEGFNVGTRNVVDVLIAERTLYAAQRDYANARLDFIFNLFSLKQQLGTLSPDDLKTLDTWLEAPKG
jgi:outer membrane protein